MRVEVAAAVGIEHLQAEAEQMHNFPRAIFIGKRLRNGVGAMHPNWRNAMVVAGFCIGESREAAAMRGGDVRASGIRSLAEFRHAMR